MRSRREPPSQGGLVPALLIVFALAGVGAAAFLLGKGQAAAPAPDVPLERAPARPVVQAPSAREAPVAAPAPPAPTPITTVETITAPAPTTAPAKRQAAKAEALPDDDLEKAAASLAKERFATYPPAAVEAGGDAWAKETYAALKAQALDELKLGRRACLWGKTRGKSPEAQKRVFLRIVDAAHRSNDASDAAFSDEIISGMYDQEERLERAAK